MSVGVDWFGCSFRNGSRALALKLLSPFVTSYVSVSGHYGYRERLVGSGVSIYYDGSESMGVFVQVSGEGCRSLQLSPEWDSWGALCSAWVSEGGKLTRVDLAFDDRSNLVSMARVVELVSQRCYRSRWHDRSVDTGMNDGGVTKSIVRMGSMSSASSLVIYDKALERLSRGEEVVGPWVRFELRLKDEQAEGMAVWFARNPHLENARGLLSSSITFLDGPLGLKGASLPAASWWVAFCEGCSGERVVVAKQVRSVEERALQWIRSHGCTFVFYMLGVDAIHGRGHFIKEVLEHGWVNMQDGRLEEIGSFSGTRDYHAAIRAWRKDDG